MGKSPGLDGLSVEWYKAILKDNSESSGRTKLIQGLCCFYNKVLATGKAPKTWTEGVLSILYKNKGAREDTRNYRPLTIMNVDYKVFAEILMTRLISVLREVIGGHLSAFLPGRLIDDNIRTVQMLVAKYKNSSDGVHLLFLNQEKAYDRVSHKFMWEILARIGAPERFIQCLRALYEGAKVNLFINGNCSESIDLDLGIITTELDGSKETCSGIRQGDQISCPLCTIVIEALAEAVLQSPDVTGVSLSSTLIKTLMYADDTVVVLKNRTEAEAMTRLLHRYGLATGAKVNWNKSCLLTVGEAEIHIPEVRRVSPENPYVHLGIPVG